MIPLTKTCTGCGKDKPLDDYVPNPMGMYYKSPKCRLCLSIYGRERARKKKAKRDAQIQFI